MLDIFSSQKKKKNDGTEAILCINVTIKDLCTLG